MASTRDLKKRITSVKNTQQTTRAMKMVSAAKLRRAQDAIVNQRPYAKHIDALIRQVAALSEGEVASPLIRRDVENATVAGEPGKKNVLLVLVTSDRGLCGAFNSNVIKATQRWIIANQNQYGRIELACVGRKGHEFFKTKKVNLGTYYVEVGGKVSHAKAKKLADGVLESYLTGGFDEVKFVYNEFKNVMTQKLDIEDFLPLQGERLESAQAPRGGSYLVRPNLKELLEQLLAKHFSIQTFRILLESQAGEHGARMSAMENATKNSGEMIRKLTLQYNKQRQANITKELLEIISGSESQKASA